MTWRRRFLSLASDSGMIALGRYSAPVVSLVTTPILARTYGVVGIAQLAVVTSASMFGSLAVDLGLTGPLAAEAARGKDLSAFRTNYALMRAVVVAAILALAGLAFLASGGNEWIRLAAAGLIAGAMTSVGEDWLLIGRRRYLRLTLCQVGGRVAYLVAVVVIATLGGNLWLAVAALICTNLLTGIGTWFAAWRLARFRRPTRTVAKRLLRLSTTYLPTRLALVVQNQLPVLVWSRVVPPSTFGIYAAGDRIARVSQSVTDSLSVALLPRLAVQTQSRRLRGRAFLATLAALGLGLVVATLLFVFSKPIVGILFGGNFDEADAVLRMASTMVPASAVISALVGAVLVATGQHRQVLLAACVACAVVCLAIFVSGTPSDPVHMAAVVSVAEWVACGWVVVQTAWVLRTRATDESERIHGA